MKGKIKDRSFRLAKLGTLSETILLTTFNLGVATADHVLSAYIDAFLGRGFYDTDPPSYQIKRAVRTLIKRGFILQSPQGLRVSTQGHWELARRRLLDSPETHVPRNWDHKWRIVIFDIPEIDRVGRDRLRRSCNRYGFYLLQKSVWVYPYNCNEFILSLKSDLGFQAEVLYMLVDRIENQSKLEEEFGLGSVKSNNR